MRCKPNSEDNAPIPDEEGREKEKKRRKKRMYEEKTEYVRRVYTAGVDMYRFPFHEEIFLKRPFLAALATCQLQGSDMKRDSISRYFGVLVTRGNDVSAQALMLTHKREYEGKKELKRTLAPLLDPNPRGQRIHPSNSPGCDRTECR